MKTSQELIICIDCSEMWLLKNDMMVQPGSRKKHNWFDTDKCPLCRGILIKESYQDRYKQYAEHRDEARHLKVLLEDWQDKSAYLQAELERREHDLKELQEQSGPGSGLTAPLSYILSSVLDVLTLDEGSGEYRDNGDVVVSLTPEEYHAAQEQVGTAGAPPQVHCVVCGAPMSPGNSPRKKRFCSDTCRKKASRAKAKYQ